ncbi:uncharacterized protein LOC118644169 isoform X2 [Monomorium pharaonis]|nr:uncharacterized protein LOC118644169 isoform X2 [Monomorium pharaonis]
MPQAEYPNNYVDKSNDIEEENFDLHDALVDHNIDFEENDESSDDNEYSENPDIIVEDEENMWINQINLENDLIVNDRRISAYLLRSLKIWGIGHVRGQKINELLQILSVVFPELPKDYRSLLSTPRSIPVKNIGNGQLWYKGIRSNIRSKLSKEYFAANQEIVMDVNIDGMKPFPQSHSQKEFWPILGNFANQDAPFIIAVFYGDGKPNNLNLFLEEYVAEVSDLQENGFEFNETIYPFRVRNYVLDAPARAFVKYCIGHGGTFACEKCCVRGCRYRSREIFIDMNANLRSDESYNVRENPEHHTGVSPLERIGTGMVSQLRYVRYDTLAKENIPATVFNESQKKQFKATCIKLISDNKFSPTKNLGEASSLYKIVVDDDKYSSDSVASTEQNTPFYTQQNTFLDKSKEKISRNFMSLQNTNSSESVYSGSSVEMVKMELLHELNSKLDFIMIQNQRLMKKLYPEEIALKRPNNVPSLPLQSEDDFENFEKFLQSEINFISTVDFFPCACS